MKKNSAWSKRGFTLVEVLAALTFAAILLPVVMKGFSLASAVTAETRRREEALTLAQNLIAEIVSLNSLKNVEPEGDFSPEHPEYRWKVNFNQWDVAGVREIEVTVMWSARGQERKIVLTTLVYQGNSQS
ncbi:MAG TPA: type II secretion system protein [bacterium]|nr:type II secretion system protein [bacterium]HOL66578.1 type II secretion system protein [bacterium]HPP11208.1 type II secretion system protein [bacterium]